MEGEPHVELVQTPEGLHGLFVEQVGLEERNEVKKLLPNYTGEALPSPL